ncbi:MFS transporter [Kribbella sp. VKM Ac-2527]|uniref:MFS transporter n=1 Tax=Kribbella caucasensis TaxID=2512215 RepID=A0A4R6KBB1_9ACTN|nr:MFS transporter [Kribbella sp. VKM Ac-2527]TDO46401.1 MFS transporter [Kribbella sp. VKM Ac-2527]
MRPAGAPHWAVVGVLALVGVLVALQGTLLLPLVSQLPEIYHVSPVKASWIITSTLLAGALATPIIARLADMFGKRRLVLITVAVMVLGSLLLATIEQYAVAVAGRALQGFAAALLPVALSIMKEILPPQRVGSGIALVSATLGIGSAIGLPTAGLMYGALGWNSLFWMTGALGVVVAVAAWWILPASPPTSPRQRFDWLGALLLLLALTPLLLVIAQGSEWGWLSLQIGVLTTVSVVALAAWIPWELHTDHPLINPRLAARRRVVLTNVAGTVIALGMLANLLIASQQLGSPDFVDGGFGLSAGATGLVMAAPAGILVLAAPAVGRLLGRYGGRRVLVLGALVMSTSYVARVFLDRSVLEVVIGAVLVGLGTSLAFSAMPMIIMSAVPPGHTASANGVNSLCRMIGTSVSTAGIAALTASTSVIVNGRAYPSAQTSHTAFVLCAAAALIACVLAWFIPRHGETAWRPRGLVGGQGNGYVGRAEQ